jgi:hypothetical protein
VFVWASVQPGIATVDAVQTTGLICFPFAVEKEIYTSWVYLPGVDPAATVPGYDDPELRLDDIPQIDVFHIPTVEINWITSVDVLKLLSKGWDPSYVFDTINCERVHLAQPEKKRKVCSLFCIGAYHMERVLDHRFNYKRITTPLVRGFSDSVVLRYALVNTDVPYPMFSELDLHIVEDLNMPLWSCLYCGFMYSRKCYGAWLLYGCCGKEHPLCVECFMSKHFPSEDEWDTLHPQGSRIPPPVPYCMVTGCEYPEVCLYPMSEIVDRHPSHYSLNRREVTLSVSSKFGVYCSGITLCAKPIIGVTDDEFDMSMLPSSNYHGKYKVTLNNPGYRYIQALRAFIVGRYMEYNDFDLVTHEDLEEKKDEKYEDWEEGDHSQSDLEDV